MNGKHAILGASLLAGVPAIIMLAPQGQPLLPTEYMEAQGITLGAGSQNSISRINAYSGMRPFKFTCSLGVRNSKLPVTVSAWVLDKSSGSRYADDPIDVMRLVAAVPRGGDETTPGVPGTDRSRRTRSEEESVSAKTPFCRINVVGIHHYIFERSVTSQEREIIAGLTRVILSRLEGRALNSASSVQVNGQSFESWRMTEGEPAYVRLSDWARVTGWSVSEGREAEPIVLRKGTKEAMVMAGGSQISVGSSKLNLGGIVADRHGSFLVPLDGVRSLEQ